MRSDTNNSARQAKVSRRRAIGVFAATAGLPLMMSVPGVARAAGRNGSLFEWNGTALGASSRMILSHPDREAARRLVVMCRDEIERLERIFSLYRSSSELSRLNRGGRLDAPSHDMVRLLSACRRFGDLSGGAFDVTVQPLWRLYADHFAAHPGDENGPDARALERVRALVDYRGVEVTARRISFARKGMAVTLNGIAQGYITDRVAELLRAEGMDNVLIQLGETHALGGHPQGRAWRLGLTAAAGTHGEGAGHDEATGENVVELRNRALATSAPHGFTFDREGRFHHLIDPDSGNSPQAVAGVSVTAPRAADADALSTALSVMEARRGAQMMERVGDATAWVVLADGGEITLGRARGSKA